MRRLLLLAITPAVTALVVAGCGSGADNGHGGYRGAPADGNRATATTRTAPGAGTTVAVSKLNVGTAGANIDHS